MAPKSGSSPNASRAMTIGERDLVERRPGLVLELRDEDVEAAIDEAVGEPGGDDLAPQAVARDLGAEPPPQRAREVFARCRSAR